MSKKLCVTFLGAVIAIVTFVNIFVAILSWNKPHNDHNLELVQLRSLNSSLQALRLELHNLQSQNSAINKSELEGVSFPVSVSQVRAESKSTKYIAPTAPAVTYNQGGDNRLKKRDVVIFTMDSISSYEKNSLTGGAAGELAVRKSLEFAFRKLGCKVTTITSDEQFHATDLHKFDTIVVDPWTWAAKGWVPKHNLVGLSDRVYVLDFFGTKSGLRSPVNPAVPQRDRLVVPPHKFLTAFGSPDNTFLGYIMHNNSDMQSAHTTDKLPQGVIWGKDVKHFAGAESSLKSIARDVKLVSTATTPVFAHSNVQWLGHQSAQGWMGLLRQSRFLVGLGNPLLGPSAIDALSVGCMFLNPVFPKPVLHNGYEYTSQHSFAEKIGPPYVCNYAQHSASQLRACVDLALSTDLPPWVPADFTADAHIARVKRIFKL